jgi:DNA-binding NtrC family response regulator
MLPAPEFLVIDDNSDSRFLLAKTLLRKFPAAILHECESTAAALAVARARPLAAIISHRTSDTPGIELLGQLRALSPGVPIVMVSGIDRAGAARAAGADQFFLYDEWLRIGTVVQDLMAVRPAEPAPR